VRKTTEETRRSPLFKWRIALCIQTLLGVPCFPRSGDPPYKEYLKTPHADSFCRWASNGIAGQSHHSKGCSMNKGSGAPPCLVPSLGRSVSSRAMTRSIQDHIDRLAHRISQLRNRMAWSTSGTGRGSWRGRGREGRGLSRGLGVSKLLLRYCMLQWADSTPGPLRGWYYCLVEPVGATEQMRIQGACATRRGSRRIVETGGVLGESMDTR